MGFISGNLRVMAEGVCVAGVCGLIMKDTRRDMAVGQG